MRKIQYFRVLVFLLTASTIQMMVHATDLNPPDWRGQPGTTYQQWLFHFDKTTRTSDTGLNCSRSPVNKTPWGQRAPPEYINNPYQQTTGICVEFKTLWPIAEHVDWLESYNGRTGVWKLQSERTFANFLNFILPNASIDKDVSTIVQLQITYTSQTNSPVIVIHYQTATGVPGNAVHDPAILDTYLADGWKHHTALFNINGCPRFQSAFVYPGLNEQTFIDSVIIDTICTNKSHL